MDETQHLRSPDAEPRGKSLAWLRLLRLPTVFTAVSNILCGYFVSSSTRSLPVLISQPELWLLLMASVGLYLGGMVLNDVFDTELDRKERPERPIPSGQISKQSAAVAGSTLMIVGVICALGAGIVSSTGYTAVQTAAILAAAVVLYDSVLKSTVAGPVGMAGCRFLNVMLGAACSGTFAEVWSGPQFDIAVALFVYILGVTWFARNEAGGASRGGLAAGVVVMLGGVGLHLRSAAQLSDPVMLPAQGAMIALALIAGNLLLRCVNAIRSGQPVILQKTVGFMLLNIIFIDAAMTFCMTGSGRLAAVVVILVLPATLMKRWIPLS